MSTVTSSQHVAPGRTRAGSRQADARFAAVLFLIAGALFVVYPVLRPYSSEVGAEGAAAFSSPNWVIAHVAGMVAFGALAAACCLLIVSRFVKATTVLGVGLILPYYGAEAFGLNAIGDAAMRYDTAHLAETADALRYGPVAIAMFGLGLVLLAIAGVALARAFWVRGARIGGALLGLGLVTYLPQFLATPEIRIAHGVVLATGLGIIAVALLRERTHA